MAETLTEHNRAENKMGVMPIPKLLITMSLPIIISMLVQALYNIVDSIFVSQVDEYIKDPLCGFVFTVNGFSTLFELIARLHDQNNLKYIPKEMPVLMVSGDADPVGDYGKGVKKSYDSLKGIGMQNVTLKMYEGARHEVLNETNRTEIMDFIYHWLDDNFLVSEQC